jgi:hypothetical protein
MGFRLKPITDAALWLRSISFPAFASHTMAIQVA